MWDQHMHCAFSGDSTTPPKEMANAALSRGLTGICFTDHHDIDYPKMPEEPDFLIPFDSYFKEVETLQAEYETKLNIHIGIELGLQPQVAEQNAQVLAKHPFDFCIGSVHVVHHQDPYYGGLFSGRTDEEAFEDYLLATLENIKAFDGFDVLGHIDYMVRYCPNQVKNYRPSDFTDLVDEILTYLISHGKGIEVNTSGYKVGLNMPHPHPEILKRYQELGGEILTIGADAHVPDHIAYDFPVAIDLLKELGFSYYTVFEGHKPQQLPL